MIKFKKSAVMLIIALAAASTFTACKGKTKETTAVSESLTEKSSESTSEKVGVKTPTEVTQSTTYTSKDKTMSIKLPDDTWKNTKDADNALVFESTGKGSITVNHISGTKVTQAKMPSSKEDVLANLENAGTDITKYEVLDFKKTTAGDADKYYTTVKCTDTAEKFVYTAGYDLVKGTDLYSITGVVEKDDDALLKAVKDSVATFQVLKQTTATPSTTKQSETQKTTDASSTGKSMTIYDENGNPIYVTQDANGVWKDSNGKTYDAQQYGVMGSDGNWYTYDAPTSDAGTGTKTPETSGFYDENGNYITVTKDANGNWVGPDGTVYDISDNSIKDDQDKSYKIPDESATSGFEKNGNYVTVTKDKNGNWVDSSGMTYTFGDTGVTDANGNFYPY